MSVDGYNAVRRAARLVDARTEETIADTDDVGSDGKVLFMLGAVGGLGIAKAILDKVAEEESK